MDVRFISSLTPHDESRLAKALIGAISKLLEAFPIAYTIRIETATSEVFDHHHAPTDSAKEPGTGLDPRSLINLVDRTVKFISKHESSEAHRRLKNALAE